MNPLENLSAEGQALKKKKKKRKKKNRAHKPPTSSEAAICPCQSALREFKGSCWGDFREFKGFSGA